MIGKADVLARAGEWQLRPDVVDKDYVLGWLLAGIAAHAETASQWVFKGGTCLKKCFFETYRFSEDLDFSLLPGAQYKADDVARILREVAERASELSGIGFPAGEVSVRERKNLQGERTFEARLGYRGPLAYPGSPKVRLDITRQEPVLDGVARRSIFHAYPDPLPPDAAVGTYTIDELFAEKVRALVERTRPRDLYDVVFVLENRPGDLDLDRVRELLREKCRVKRIPAPSSAALVQVLRGAAELRSEWGNMLGHQLPELPPIESVQARAEGLFGWLDRPVAVPMAALPAAPVAADQEMVAAAGLQYWGTGVGIEAVRFAGANRLKVEFTYHGRRRVAEPYSLRRATGTGNLLLYAFEDGAATIKAYRIGEMSGLRATGIPFRPQYRVEFAASGPISAPSAVPASHRSPAFGPISGLHRTSGSRRVRRAARTDRIYVYECSFCGRRFRRSRMNSSLRPHKDRSGSSCPGRHGRHVDTRY